MTEFTKDLTPVRRRRGFGIWDHGIQDADGNMIAELAPYTGGRDGKTLVHLPARANAYLYAAAPKLHAACATAIERLAADPAHADLIELLKAAVAAAEPSPVDDAGSK